MKLNLHIIGDALAIEKSKIISDSNIEMELVNVRLLPDDPRQCGDQYLYLIDHQLSEAYLQIEKLSLIILNDNGANLKINHSWNVILMAKNEQLWDVFEKVQGIFDDFNRWHEALTDEILNRQPIQQLLDLSAQVLNNPIALLDISFIMIAKSGNFPDRFNDPIWESVLYKGYGAVENIPQQYRNLSDLTIKERKPVLVPPLSDDHQKRIICATLVQNQVPFANLAMTNLVSEFTVGQHSLVYHIQQLLEISLQLPKPDQNVNNDICYLISQLIQKKYVDPDLVKHFFAARKWDEDDAFFCVVFDLISDLTLTEYNHLVYLKHLREALPHAYTLFVDNRIVSICLCKYGMAFPATIAQMISPKLTKLALCASVSLKQPSYEFLAAAMHQAEMALQLGRKKTMDQQIYTFKEVYAEYIIQVLSKDQDTYSLCLPIVQKIVKNHDQWSLELIHTLWIYLQNGKRISQTADKLFIHRNTLVNRLQSIEKILEIDFETIDDEDLDMLLISCFIVKTKHRLL